MTGGASPRPAPELVQACPSKLAISLLKIYSFTTGPAVFLGYQSALFRRFLEDEFELIAVNDGQDEEASAAIERAASALELRCERVPLPPCGDPSIGLGNAMEFALSSLARNDDDISLLIHGDIFACRPFSARALFEQADLVAQPELKRSDDDSAAVYYPWSGVIGLRVSALTDLDTARFGPGVVNGVRCDTGGMFALYLAEHPHLRLRALVKERVCAGGDYSAFPAGTSPSLFDERGVELVSGVFFHYLSGSGWLAAHPSSRAAKQAAALELFDALLGGATMRPAAHEAVTTPWPEPQG